MVKFDKSEPILVDNILFIWAMSALERAYDKMKCEEISVVELLRKWAKLLHESPSILFLACYSVRI